jgi:predicted ATP-grasp superfamily ATP-dependent carboligase
MVLETPTEEAWPKEIEILQRMADPAIPEDQLDFEGMAEEIRAEVKKYEKETPQKGPKKKEPVAKKGKVSKGKKGKKWESEKEDAGDSDED